jgi:hypothetical protein
MTITKILPSSVFTITEALCFSGAEVFARPSTRADRRLGAIGDFGSLGFLDFFSIGGLFVADMQASGRGARGFIGFGK